MYAICHTEGCGNAGLGMQVPDDAEVVACGPCGQPITDLSGTPPELPTEVPSWLE